VTKRILGKRLDNQKRDFQPEVPSLFIAIEKCPLKRKAFKVEVKFRRLIHLRAVSNFFLNVHYLA